MTIPFFLSVVLALSWRLPKLGARFLSSGPRKRRESASGAEAAGVPRSRAESRELPGFVVASEFGISVSSRSVPKAHSRHSDARARASSLRRRRLVRARALLRACPLSRRTTRHCGARALVAPPVSTFWLVLAAAIAGCGVFLGGSSRCAAPHLPRPLSTGGWAVLRTSQCHWLRQIPRRMTDRVSSRPRRRSRHACRGSLLAA